jgi:hypothetical protein
MPTGKTLQGNTFRYAGSLTTGLVVSFKSAAIKISPEIIDVIRTEITQRSPVLMGTSHKPVVPDSIGETLWTKHHVVPQVMSYVVPLLVEEGFCTVNHRKPFIIRRNSPDGGER